jgi:hypothetical protein
MEGVLMGSGDKNDRKRLVALTSVKARGGCEAVLAPHPTAGAANSGQIVPLAPRKPDGFLRNNLKNLISEFSRVKTPSIDESSP